VVQPKVAEADAKLAVVKHVEVGVKPLAEAVVMMAAVVIVIAAVMGSSAQCE